MGTRSHSDRGTARVSDAPRRQDYWAATTPRLPEQFRSTDHPDNFVVSELVSEAAGAHSPFGDTEFPVPPETLFYIHPTPAERPNLAGDN